MSHDQKPPRVRVVQNGGAPNRRRRSDRGAPAVAVIDGDAVIEPSATTIAGPGRAATIMLGAIFGLAACGGGILVALLAR